MLKVHLKSAVSRRELVTVVHLIPSRCHVLNAFQLTGIWYQIRFEGVQKDDIGREIREEAL